MFMWSSARYNLGLTDDEFFELTPRKFDALQKRHKYKTESNELLFAQLNAAIYNTGFRAPEKPVTILDGMPSRWKRKEETAKAIKKRTRKTIAEELRRVMAAFGGMR